MGIHLIMPEIMQREQDILRVTMVGTIVNVLLTIGKIAAGIWGRSAAMVADGIHSLSDLLSDVVVIVFTHIASKGRDRKHRFGHGKFEALATLLMSAMLIIVGINLLSGSVRSIAGVLHGETLPTPTYIALVAAILSIVSKEWMFRITAKVGRRTGSAVVVANAWHHRSDAISSVGALVGIGGAILLGEKWVVLDPLVSCVISVAIMVVAVRMAQPSLSELLETCLPEDVENEIIAIASNVDGVVDIHELKTRSNGMSYIIDAHIVVDSCISVVQAHDIATNVEHALCARYGNETQINIHVEPDVNAE